MTKAKAKKWIEALCQLKKDYKTEEWRRDEVCSLCLLVDAKDVNCSDCLWKLFEGHDCGYEMSQITGFSCSVVKGFDTPFYKWRNYRLSQIDRWIRKLKDC